MNIYRYVPASYIQFIFRWYILYKIGLLTLVFMYHLLSYITKLRYEYFDLNTQSYSALKLSQLTSFTTIMYVQLSSKHSQYSIFTWNRQQLREINFGKSLVKSVYPRYFRKTQVKHIKWFRLYFLILDNSIKRKEKIYL